jgi:hypothetical protein
LIEQQALTCEAIAPRLSRAPRERRDWEPQAPEDMTLTPPECVRRSYLVHIGVGKSLSVLTGAQQLELLAGAQSARHNCGPRIER